MIQLPTFYEPDLASGIETLGSEESKHCIRVLRKRAGDRIRIIDGKGLEAEYEINDPHQKKCGVHEVNTIVHKKNRAGIHIGLAPTKQLERTEWFVEKAIEIGLDKITFLECFNSERRSVNMDRIQKKAITALKQSGNLFLPELVPLTPYTQVIGQSHEALKFIAYLDDPPPPHLLAQIKNSSPALVLIGPEGDFSKEEIELAKNQGFKSAGLGDSRLRTETAGIAACHILNLKSFI